MTARVALTAALVCLVATGASAQQKKLQRTEVVVLADLSNRIDPTIHAAQVARDTAIIHLIADEFAGVVKRNRFLFSRDRLRMLYSGGENLPEEPRVDVAEMNANHRVVVKELQPELAIFEKDAVRPYFQRRTTWNGADLWGWFKNTAPGELKVEDPTRDVQTRIIMLTDGYLEFAASIKRPPGTAMQMRKLRGRADWTKIYPSVALVPTGARLPSTKVLMLELAPLHPEANTTEQEILQRYWTDWFSQMGVQVTFLTNSEALPSVRDAVRSFLAH